ncbi:MAG TPA: carboxypeptidase regulatory-like domain-containing protein [Longimicrobium sp.]|nr:carboxypeptidase regulatory-like domain-containing protein [Longimicrobium sp.]
MRPLRPHALALLALALLPATTAAAQRAVVRGQVVDTRSGNPVAHAAVYVGDDRTVALADAQGRFELKHIRPGTRAIWADAPGYSMDVGVVEVPADSASVTVEMRSDPVRLATLMVSTSRIDRRARAFAGTVRVFRERDMAGAWYSTLLQMVESRGGVRTTFCPGYGLGSTRESAGFAAMAFGSGRGDCVYSRGRAESSAVYIDEARWIGGLGSLSDFRLPDVARVEVYGHGREVRVYTRMFMDWVSERPFVPVPIGHGF